MGIKTREKLNSYCVTHFSGGIKLTVEGQSFQVLLQPVLELTMNYSIVLVINPGELMIFIVIFKGVS